MFDTLVKYMYENLNDFGEIMAADGKPYKVMQEKFQRKTAATKERGMLTGAEKNTQ